MGLENASVAAAVHERVASTRDRFWVVDDFADLQPDTAVWQALSRAVAAGDLRRVTKGVYWRGAVVAGFESLGMSPPPVDKTIPVVLNLTSGYGPAGPWAANVLGLSTQVPREEWYAIPKRAPARPPRGAKLISRPSRLGRVEQQLNPTEVAVLEVLDDPRWIEADDAKTGATITRLADRGTIRRERLIAAAQTEPSKVRNAIHRVLRPTG